MTKRRLPLLLAPVLLAYPGAALADVAPPASATASAGPPNVSAAPPKTAEAPAVAAERAAPPTTPTPTAPTATEATPTGAVPAPTGPEAVPGPATVAATPTASSPAGPTPASTASPALAAASAGGLNYERDVTWDLNLEGGYGRFFSDPAKNTLFGRARGGVLFIHNSSYRALGLTYEYSAFSPATFGVQGEVLNLELGLWTQLGAFVDVSGRFGAQLAAGWSLFGVEGQYRAVEDRGSGFAVFGKVRLPISIIARALR